MRWLAPLLLSGCNVLVDTTAEQCETALDCKNKGGEFADTYCTAEKICTDSLPSCTSNRGCTAALGEPGYCRPDGRCTRVLTADCTEVVPKGALQYDDVVPIGFMAPLRGRFASQGTALRRGAALALDEIEAFTNGVPGTGTGAQRHLAMIVCHDTPDDVDTLQRPLNVARHLVDTVGVPAIIGPSKIPAAAVDVLTKVTMPRNVLTLSPSATQPNIPDLDAKALFWRTVPSDSLQAHAWGPLSWLVVDALVQKQVFVAGARLNVAFVSRQDSYGLGISAAFAPDLKDTEPIGWSYDHETQVDWEAMANAIVQAHPQVMLAFSTTEFVTELLPRIEERWDGNFRKPYYFLTEGVRVDELLTEVEKNPDLSGRIIGTAPGARNSPLFDGFASRFNTAFRQEPGHLAEFAYDAAYLLAYAVAGAKTQRPGGIELSRAMQAMSCSDGAELKADPEALATGLRAAEENPCVNFSGASGPLDFNGKREAETDFTVWCPDRDPSGKFVFRSVLDGLYFDAKTKLIVGLPSGMTLPLCGATQ